MLPEAAGVGSLFAGRGSHDGGDSVRLDKYEEVVPSSGEADESTQGVDPRDAWNDGVEVADNAVAGAAF